MIYGFISILTHRYRTAFLKSAEGKLYLCPRRYKLFHNTHPATLCADTILRRRQNAFFNKNLHNSIEYRHICEVVRKLPLAMEIFRNRFFDKFCNLSRNDLCICIKISILQVVTDFE